VNRIFTIHDFAFFLIKLNMSRASALLLHYKNLF